MEKQVEYVLTVDPADFGAKVMLATCKFMAGHYPLCLQVCKEAFRSNPKDHNLNRLMYLVLIKLNKLEEAEQFLRSIYGGFSQLFWVNHALATLMVRKQNYAEAEVHAVRAVEAFRLSATR